MVVIAECRKRIMLVEDNEQEVNELTKCRVYNRVEDTLAPALPIGSWTARVFPWEKPTKPYEKELRRVQEIIDKEKKEEEDGQSSGSQG